MADALPQSRAYPPEAIDATLSALRTGAWRRGKLRWKLHSSQRGVYEAIHNTASSRFVMEISRRWGKSFLLATIAVETCLRKPRQRVVYGAPTLKALQEFILPAFDAVCEDAPPEQKPTWNQAAGHLTFPNGSWVHLFGAENKLTANRGRGSEAALAVFDEAGFCPVLGYVLRSVFRPSLLHSGGRVILGSTPAEEAGHEFTAIAEKAEARGTYARRTVWDNPRLTKAQIQAFIEDDARDEGMTPEQFQATDEFRREYLAQRVVDQMLVVVPEWEHARPSCFVPVERPDVFDAMSVLDFGGHDPHFGLFGYFHFAEAKWVIEDELFLHAGENTAELAQAVKAKERQLWGVETFDGTLRALHLAEERQMLQQMPDWLSASIELAAPHQPYARWCDNDIQLARDLAQLHGLAFLPTAKDDLQLQVNNFRVMVQRGEVLVHPRCVHLDRHLRTTSWANHHRTGFRRTSNGEHGDGVAAAVYGARNLSRRNPNPTPIPISMARQAALRQQQSTGLLPASNPLTAKLLGRR